MSEAKLSSAPGSAFRATLERALAYTDKEGPSTFGQIAEGIGCSESTVRRAFWAIPEGWTSEQRRGRENGHSYAWKMVYFRYRIPDRDLPPFCPDTMYWGNQYEYAKLSG